MIRIKKTGMYVPEKEIGNEYFSDVLKLDTSPDWIEKKIGIKSRRFSDNQTSSDLGFLACKDLMEELDTVDMIIVSSVTPDLDTPSIGSLIQNKLKCKCPVISINVGCAGFVYAFDVACQYILSNACKKILVIGTDSITKLINFEDRLTSVFFGDGAGVVILEKNNTNTILSRYFDASADLDAVSNKSGFVKMDGRKIWNFVLEKFPYIFSKLIDLANLKKENVDILIPHQANARMIEAAVKSINFPINNTIIDIESYGNMVSASIPVALHNAIKNKKIKHGDNVMIIGYGSGLSWGGILFKYLSEEH